MTVENRTVFGVDDITEIILECRECLHSLVINLSKERFVIREDRECPVCSSSWWKGSRGRSKSREGVDADSTCALIDAIRYAREAPSSGVKIKLIISNG